MVLEPSDVKSMLFGQTYKANKRVASLLTGIIPKLTTRGERV